MIINTITCHINTDQCFSIGIKHFGIETLTVSMLIMAHGVIISHLLFHYFNSIFFLARIIFYGLIEKCNFLLGLIEKCNSLFISFCFFYCLDGQTIYQQLWLVVTWSGISYTQRSANNSTYLFFQWLDRFSDKLEGFTGQIWNLPETSGLPASFTVSGTDRLMSLSKTCRGWKSGLTPLRVSD